MAPPPHSLAMLQNMWKKPLVRDLGTTPPPNAAAPYSDAQQHTLQILAVTFSAVSVASALLAFYWFRRMRRSFRHDLIMFLIQSDMFKALWFMIYPIVVFVHGPVSSNSTFCAVNGFFIALGIEASDFAVLMIALHTALHIFRANPRTAAGEGGLWPYRKIAFVLWIIFPVLMASLAFINKRPYVSVGTYCYLPIRPFWYRLALSWIPRYLIFITIIIIYCSIYLWVMYKFRDFSNTNSPKDGSFEQGVQNRRLNTNAVQKRHSLPDTPPLAYNGLLPESRHGSMTASEISQAGRQISDATFRDAGTSVSYRASTGNRTDSRKLSESGDMLANLYPTNLHPTSIDIAPSIVDPGSTKVTSSTPESSTWSAFAAKFNRPSTVSSRSKSLLSFFAFLRANPQHPDLSSFSTTPISQLELVDSRGNNVTGSEVQRTREKIRRQLRFMFIYPLVYMAMWVLPFVSHVLQYEDKYAANPPFVLSAFVVIMITSQCAVDCWLFSTREKPWRHIPGTNGSLGESLKFWDASWGLPTSIKSRKKAQRGPGKSRAEMVTEARRAYKRRDDEIAARRNELEIMRDSAKGGREAASSAPRSWWDSGAIGSGVQGVDSAMSPVLEEVLTFESPVEGHTIQFPEQSAEDSNATTQLENSSDAKAAEPQKNIYGNELAPR